MLGYREVGIGTNESDFPDEPLLPFQLPLDQDALNAIKKEDSELTDHNTVSSTNPPSYLPQIQPINRIPSRKRAAPKSAPTQPRHYITAYQLFLHEVFIYIYIYIDASNNCSRKSAFITSRFTKESSRKMERIIRVG